MTRFERQNDFERNRSCERKHFFDGTSGHQEFLYSIVGAKWSRNVSSSEYRQADCGVYWKENKSVFRVLVLLLHVFDYNEGASVLFDLLWTVGVGVSFYGTASANVRVDVEEIIRDQRIYSVQGQNVQAFGGNGFYGCVSTQAGVYCLIFIFGFFCLFFFW